MVRGFIYDILQNVTLEHYTNYKASDLKTPVHALQGLQLNTNGCPLNAIRAKYRQDKVNCLRMVENIIMILNLTD